AATGPAADPGAAAGPDAAAGGAEARCTSPGDIKLLLRTTTDQTTNRTTNRTTTTSDADRQACANYTKPATTTGIPDVTSMRGAGERPT
nr:hypothetical protein [Micromonospora sp. DSM 115978]